MKLKFGGQVFSMKGVSQQKKEELIQHIDKIMLLYKLKGYETSFFIKIISKLKEKTSLDTYDKIVKNVLDNYLKILKREKYEEDTINKLYIMEWNGIKFNE